MKSNLTVCVACAALLAATGAFAQAPPAGDEVVLVVNGEPIMRSTVDKLIEPVRRAKVPPQQLVRYQQQAVQNIVTDMLISQYLRDEGFTPTTDEVTAEIGRRKRIYESTMKPGSPDFAEALRRVGTSVAEMTARPDPRLRFSCCIRRGVAEKDILRIYETEKDSWASVCARHILIGTRALKTDEEKAAARKKAEDVRARVLAGEDFAALAKEFSDCPSKQEGGDLGHFPRHGKLVEPFAKAAFELDVDGVSPVVETQFGYHIIQTTEARKGDSPLEEVREYVANAAAERRGQELFGSIYKRAKIERPDQPPVPGAPASAPRPAAPAPPAER